MKRILKWALIAVAVIIGLPLVIYPFLSKESKREIAAQSEKARAEREVASAAGAKARAERDAAQAQADLEKRIAGPTGKGNALRVCQAFVRPLLKSPSTADFASVFSTAIEHRKTKDGEHLLNVNSWVDAQSGLGLKVRTEFMCQVAAATAEEQAMIYLATKGPDGAWKDQYVKKEGR